MKEEALKILTEYRELFSTDQDVEKFFAYLKNNENCTDRKNMNGHLDADALVVYEGKVLMIYHRALNRWLQPGGHVDSSDKTFIDSAIREVKEETGLDVEQVEGVFAKIPISLDVQIIPENRNKQEGWHVHYSLMFLLKLKNINQKIENKDDGVEDVKWFEIEEALKSEIGTALPKAISKYINFHQN